ncbi:MAG: hypothetical protein JXR14_12230 [Paracoccaceae bacterium]
MKALVPFCAGLLMASPAVAHVGHVGELAGHDHWVAGAAIGVAAAITLWGVLKGKKAAGQQPEEAGDSEEETA